MTGTWKVFKEHVMGVAIYNFAQDGLHRLQLSVGDAVVIKSQSDDWYFGCNKYRETLCGIFPKSFVCIREYQNDHLINEITSVLREWGHQWKNLYIAHSEHFSTMRQHILELISYRSKILSGTLTVDELKDMKKLATSKIDTGNQLLGLDMIVRDEHGNFIDPESTSTIELFHAHESTAEKIKKTSVETNKKSSKPQNMVFSHIFFVNVRNFVCKMVDDVELLLTLYDGKEMKAITENYVLTWSKLGLTADIELLHNLKVLFTDLGSRDLRREKVYLVCYAVRIGGMEAKDVDHRRSSVVNTSQKNKTTDNMRRPFGVAAMDITAYMRGSLEGDPDFHYFTPFIQCCEKDSLDGTLRRILTQKEINVPKNNSNNNNNTANQGLFCSLKLLSGDVIQVREENPHLVLGNVSIARKMGFPEVILPGDVRNDLYLTLLSGEFSKGSKTTDKNVEVTVKVCNEHGKAIPGVITLGGGASFIDEYRSVIYYHEDKPRWCETFKIAVPIEEFKQAHLKFTFKHRSSNETKDKSEKPFALSYVKLMQRNGTTLQDVQHELLVYKIDNKKYDEFDTSYFRLPSTRGELNELNMEKKPSYGPLSLSTKDNFIIATNVCSTKLTQNVDLLGLLNWASNETNLKASLIALMKVDGEEVVKFLQDVLDALFSILMSNTECDDYDDMVFECLLYIIGLVSDRKYQHFQPVLDLYITESFSATLAYKKLISVLRKRIDSATSCDGQDKDLLKTMKSLQYCMRFIVESRLLFTELDQDEEEFSQTLTDLLTSISNLMKYETDGTLLVQGACLKFLPSTIPHLIRVYSGVQLSIILTDLLGKLPAGRLTKQKMMTVNDIVHSRLFLSMECRQILLPRITILVKGLLESKEEGLSGTPGKSVDKAARLLGENRHRLNQHRGYSEEVELCVKILSDVLDLTSRKDVGSTTSDIKDIMLTVLRTVIQTNISMDRENPLIGNLVSVMLSIFRQMTENHYNIYIQHFGTTFDLLDFLMEILLVFKDLVSKTVFPSDWCEMIMTQNKIILKALKHFSKTIREYFHSDFEQQAWSNFFHCAIAFLTQPALQLENFTAAKRNHILKRYRDMRYETAQEIHTMWMSLGAHKILFVPSLVGPILEMALIPEVDLRKKTIPLFFDMMQCEFFSSKNFDGYVDKRNTGCEKKNFDKYENEMIAKLDTLIEGGRGDEEFKDLWLEVMTPLCRAHTRMKEQALRFVNIVAKLMDHLLQYREIIHADSQEHRMLCTENLLEFYSEIEKKEMYIRYVNKLCELHLECDNYTEAAYTLKLYTDQLAWSDETLSSLLKSNQYPHCQTHRELKECLYNDIIEYFDKGKMWECALAVCKELVAQYEEETYDYTQLSVLLRRMAKFYDAIIKQLRPEPEYFRVAYYGGGHPPFLRNKVFVYRGKEYERLSDFCSRTLNQLPSAEQMNKLSPPSREILESNKQYVQINKVDPIMDEKKNRLSGKPITAEAVLRYHRVNDVQKFRFSRPAPKKELLLHLNEKDANTSGNEFGSLWLERTVLTTSRSLPGILRWFPVVHSETYFVSPLRNAIETMENMNSTLRDLIISHRADVGLPLNPLSMKLNGILDPAVMGGIDNYEKAFLNPEYRDAHPNEAQELQKLENLIAQQIPLLNLGVQLHKIRAPSELLPFHQRLEQCFIAMRARVEAKYGKRTCDIQIEYTPSKVTMRKNVSPKKDSHRLSDSNISTNESNNTSRMNILSTASLQKALGNTTLGTYRKKDAKRRSSRKSDAAMNSKNEPTSQWYTGTPEPLATSLHISNSTISLPSTPIFELRQELTPTRPLRSEAEKERRLSNRWSGQSQTCLRSNGNGFEPSGLGKGNRDSVGTTDSTASEDDPPPLPTKARGSNYNFNEESAVNYNSIPYSNCLVVYRSKNIPNSPDSYSYSEKPPTPPPKPKRPPYAVTKALISPSDSESSTQDSSPA